MQEIGLLLGFGQNFIDFVTRKHKRQDLVKNIFRNLESILNVPQTYPSYPAALVTAKIAAKANKATPTLNISLPFYLVRSCVRTKLY